MKSAMNIKPLLASAALALSSLAAQAALVSLSAAAPAQVGKGVDVLVSVNTPFAGLALDDELLSFGFRLSYDMTQLSFTGFNVADGWDDDSGWLGAGQFGGSSFPGVANQSQATLFLGTLHFDVLQAGQSQISLVDDAGNLNHGLGFLWSGVQPLNATLALSASAIPEPASVLLVGLGLGALCVARRRNTTMPEAA